MIETEQRASNPLSQLCGVRAAEKLNWKCLSRQTVRFVFLQPKLLEARGNENLSRMLKKAPLTHISTHAAHSAWSIRRVKRRNTLIEVVVVLCLHNFNFAIENELLIAI